MIFIILYLIGGIGLAIWMRRLIFNTNSLIDIAMVIGCGLFWPVIAGIFIFFKIKEKFE